MFFTSKHSDMKCKHFWMFCVAVYNLPTRTMYYMIVRPAATVGRTKPMLCHMRSTLIVQIFGCTGRPLQMLNALCITHLGLITKLHWNILPNEITPQGMGGRRMILMSDRTQSDSSPPFSFHFYTSLSLTPELRRLHHCEARRQSDSVWH